MAKRTCSVPECGRGISARGMCNAHYIRWRTTGDPGPAKIRRRAKDAICEFPGCGRRHEAHGLCPGHLYQKNSGKALAPLMPRLKTTDRDSQGRKLCRLCAQWLPVEDFYTNPTPKDGLHNRCINCHRSERLHRTYGITVDEYQRMLEEQGSACKICGGINEDGRELSVDHDHECCPGRKSCGKCIRGLLCNPCNRALGYMRDSVVRLEAAVAYLSSAREYRGDPD